MRPIFNESFIEKKKFVGLVNSARDPLEKPPVTEKRFKEEKKEKKKKLSRKHW